MANSLKVVFRHDVRGIAQAGDVKTVSPGYARNYLFPRDLAFLATDTALKQWETERQGALSKAEKKRSDATAVGQRIDALSITVSAKAGQDGQLFGSVGKQELAEALAKESIKIDKRSIELAEPIRQTGTYNVPVRVGAGVQSQLKVTVVAA